MILTAIVIGALLVVTGVFGYIQGVSDGKASLTALIPAVFGFIIMDMGILAKIKPSLHKHLMHVAVVVALIGFFIPTARLVSRINELTMSPAIIAQIVTAVLCLIFVLLAIRSFIAARNSR
jgi:hypothetical protein